jgi:pimeloyl-ACP methyl ester carboxylesterase
VLVHGLVSDHRFWENVLPALAGDYRVTALDLPGHGEGSRRLTVAEAHPRELAATLIESLQADGIEVPHVAGLSLGGWVALEMAALGAVSSVTALAPAGLWPEGARVHREREEEALRYLLLLLDPAVGPLTRRSLVKRIGLRLNVVHPERVTDEQFLAAARAIERARGHAACDRAMVRSRFERWHKVTVPVTVAFGDDDRVLPSGDCQDRRQLPEHAEWVVVPSCGHAMTWDQPEACVDLIRRTTARGLGQPPA